MIYLWKKISTWYSDCFSIDEFATSLRLKYVFIASWALCVYDLTANSRPAFNSNGTLVCWPFFDSCNELAQYLLPNSFAYNALTAIILFFLLLSAIFLAKKKYAHAHFFLLSVIIYKTIFTFFLFSRHNTNFALFHLFPSFVLLFSKNKIQALKFSFAFIYFFTPRVKFDDGWILGTYFSTTTNGLPLFPNSSIPILTNLTIIGEMIFSIGLFYPNKKFNAVSLWSWTIFHIYSAILVGYFYPVRCLAFLWTIYGLDEQLSHEEDNRNKFLNYKTVIILALFSFINFIPNLISKNPNITTEGLDYGFHMINANYQCQTSIDAIDKNNNNIMRKNITSSAPMNRCFVFDIFQQIKSECKKFPIDTKVSWTYWQSRNGSPFYELINEKDACKLSYKPFSHNEWIKYPTDSLIKGYPFKNNFGPVFKKDTEFISEKATDSNKVQSFWKTNYEGILLVYKFSWIVGFFYLLYLGFGLPYRAALTIKRNSKLSLF